MRRQRQLNFSSVRAATQNTVREDPVTLLTLLKFCLGAACLPGLVFIGPGVWNIWTDYDFARHAEVKRGIFMGYHITRHEEVETDASGWSGMLGAVTNRGNE